MNYTVEALRRQPGTVLKPLGLGAALGGLVGGGYAAITDHGESFDKKRALRHAGAGAVAGATLGGLVGSQGIRNLAQRQAANDLHGHHTVMYNQALDNRSADVFSYDGSLVNVVPDKKYPSILSVPQNHPAITFRDAISKPTFALDTKNVDETKKNGVRFIRTAPRSFLADISSTSADFDPSQLEAGTQRAYGQGPGSRRRSGAVAFSNVPPGLSKTETSAWIDKHIQDFANHSKRYSTEHLPVAPLDLSQGLRFDPTTLETYREQLKKMLL